MPGESLVSTGALGQLAITAPSTTLPDPVSESNDSAATPLGAHQDIYPPEKGGLEVVLNGFRHARMGQTANPIHFGDALAALARSGIWKHAPVEPDAGLFADIGGIGSRNKLQPGKPLVFIGSLFATSGPLSGSGAMHDIYGEVLANHGCDVVVLEANNNLQHLNGKPYHVSRILFQPGPETPVDPTAPSFSPYTDFNVPAFTTHPTSKNRFADLSEAQLARLLFLWDWAFRASTLVFGIPDVCWNGHAWILNAMTAPVVPTVFTVHGTCTTALKNNAIPQYREIARYGAEQAKLAFAISGQEFEKLTAGPIEMQAEKVEIVPNGYNDTAFNLDVDGNRQKLLADFGEKLDGVSPNDKWIVFVGKHAYFKGFDLLLNALAGVRNRAGNGSGGKVHLLVVGGAFDDVTYVSDPLSKLDLREKSLSAREMVKQLDLEGLVHFVGSLPQPEMARFIKASDSYVLPSRDEPFGLVAPEGMAVGIPPVLSDSGGFAEIVGLYQKGDRQDIARMFTPDKPLSLRVLRAVQGKLRKLDETQDEHNHPLYQVALSYLGQAKIDIQTGTYKLSELSELEVPKGIKREDVGSFVAAMLRDTSSQLAIENLVEAILADLAEMPDERQRRGLEAARFAQENFKKDGVVVSRHAPLIEKILQESEGVDFGLDRQSSAPRSSQRQQMLAHLASRPDGEVSKAFRQLQSAIERGDKTRDDLENIGRQWRMFFDTVATAIGTRAEFLNAFDPETHDYANPNAIFSVVARLAGVPTQEVLTAMASIDKVSPWFLLGPKRRLRGMNGILTLKPKRKEGHQEKEAVQAAG
ncbi:MAG: hypothetical protein A2W61_03400 [Deltaproteobacteria bacterium RIFCSPLOWO2_01_44_7]|nr:MAG: hypothetical protein A2712_05000 [Deltaproteobacteria bacterium RIFCSPHIGHO2_01_FULL_43_49]OGQ15926.1 MAG: hypothetical protein A3D22_07660 [Deltaproteobacteria bacterium RIFCSPHIGHO2_02_FULL_44_53]OGQ28888.1 MAG: hypothetical protein A3D98_06030 [Deltaproteobacteria bacterium RIFCSPHIGHO2_12_FULL_44_21]OGQ30980.1 MAG: hypothetical protein A2979_02050 [Deltaproteobacteria bacterium RIFCSPLOWO2_01_FULL_45_74]OGQ41521.1 MAG: hypothetical protein A2W61_03400 [Deltaproteobacteria bacterium 